MKQTYLPLFIIESVRDGAHCRLFGLWFKMPDGRKQWRSYSFDSNKTKLDTEVK